MIARKSILLTWLALVITAGFGGETLADTDEARRAARAAEAAVKRGDYRAAERSLTSIDCQGSTDCQALLAFSRAWVYESWSSIPSEQSGDRLARALDLYRRASDASPRNTRILANLALAARRAGEIDTAVGAMQAVIELDPNEAYRGYLFIGDSWLSAGNDDRALHNYRLAVSANPDDSQGHLRLLDYYRKTGDAAALFEYAMRIRLALPAVAATGFEYALGLLNTSNQTRAGESLARWTAVRAELGALSAANLDRLPGPEEWNNLGLRQLHRVVASDRGPPSADDITWWDENDVRRDAMSRLLRLKATRLIAAAERADSNEDERTEAHRIAIAYLTAAVDLAPRYEAYLGSSLAGSSNARLDAATNLVTLHHSLKAGGDPAGLSGVSQAELEQMTEVLFYGKGGAYAAGQLRDIQRFHTVLGLIYYETRRDTSSGADNATFQLSHALRTAERVAEENPDKYEPLPELRVRLADVYQRQGKTAESGQEMLRAAMGFLEKDNLREASKALNSAKQSGASTSAIETILQGRQAVLIEGSALLKARPGSEKVQLDPKIGWLEDPAALQLPTRFVEGQRFKTLADLGSRLTDTKDRALAISVNDLALDAASKNQVLTSPTDIKRIQRLETEIRQSIMQAPEIEPVQIEGMTRPVQTGSSAPSWTLPSQQGTVQIKIDPLLLDDNRSDLNPEEIQNRLRIDRKNLQIKPQFRK